MRNAETHAFNSARWTMLTAAGLAGGLGSGALLGIPLGQVLNTVAATIAGAMIGLALAVVIVQELGIIITGAPLHVAEAGTVTRAVAFLLVGLVAGSVLGVAQWIVLRAQKSTVRHWIVVCGAALAVAFCLASLLVDASGIRYASEVGRFAFVVLAGITFGALTSRPLRSAA